MTLTSHPRPTSLTSLHSDPPLQLPLVSNGDVSAGGGTLAIFVINVAAVSIVDGPVVVVVLLVVVVVAAAAGQVGVDSNS